MQRYRNHVEGINNSVRFYISSRMASDSAFPFDAGDPYLAIVTDGVVVLAPPDDTPDQIDLSL